MSLTNTHGRPARVDSPWIEKKISLMRSVVSAIARIIRAVLYSGPVAQVAELADAPA